MPLLLRVAGVDLTLGGPPVAGQVQRLSQSARAGALATYPGADSLAAASPAGFRVNERRAVVGHGRAAWQRAARGLETTSALDLGWARFWRNGRGNGWARGDVVVVGARLLPALWAANVSRVVGVRRGRSRVAVAWGTSARHVLRGEEVVAVERASNGDVVCSIRSFSRPATPIAWLAYPAVVLLQLKFAHDVCKRMKVIAAETG